MGSELSSGLRKRAKSFFVFFALLPSLLIICDFVLCVDDI